MMVNDTSFRFPSSRAAVSLYHSLNGMAVAMSLASRACIDTDKCQLFEKGATLRCICSYMQLLLLLDKTGQP